MTAKKNNGDKAKQRVLGQYVSIGLLAIIVMAVFAVGGFALTSEGHVRAVAQNAVSSHETKDVDEAHRRLGKKYVNKHEHLKALHEIREYVVRIHEQLKQLKEQRSGQ